MRRPGIDFSDIPEVSPAQLRAMRRVGRPPLGAAARRLIAIRIDPQVLDAVRREAKRRGLGYSPSSTTSSRSTSDERGAPESHPTHSAEPLAEKASVHPWLRRFVLDRCPLSS